MTEADSSLNSALTNEDTKYKMHSYILNISYKLNFHTIFIQSLKRISKDYTSNLNSLQCSLPLKNRVIILPDPVLQHPLNFFSFLCLPSQFYF